MTVRRSKCWKVDQWNSKWWSRKFLNSKVVARNVFVSLRAFEWYQNYKIWPIKILWNIIQSWLHHFMRRIIKFIFWRNSRFEFLFIQDKRAIVRLLLCLLFASIVSVEWPVVGRPAWCHILGEKKVSTLSPNPIYSQQVRIGYFNISRFYFYHNPSSWYHFNTSINTFFVNVWYTQSSFSYSLHMI